MSSNKKKYLTAEDFQRAFKRLDQEMSTNNFLVAFAPINVVTVGGFLAVTYFQNRDSTGDLDYMIEPEWRDDNEITTPSKEKITFVARKERLELDWMNNALEIWTTPQACKSIFEQAYAQNILLFDGELLKVWAAPFEWALERKLRRVAYADREEKKVDMDDALALFRYFKNREGRPLDMTYFRNLNLNGFDVVPEVHHMELVAKRFRAKYNEELFFSIATESSTAAAGPGLPGYPADSRDNTGERIDPDWSEWMWYSDRNQWGRYRTVNGEYENEYRDSQATASVENWSDWAWHSDRNQWGRYRLVNGQYEYEFEDPQPSSTSNNDDGFPKGKGKRRK